MKKIARAFLSIHDKVKATELATFLSKNGVEIITTTLTHKLLEKAGVHTRDINSFTGAGNNEIFGSQFRTLHPVLHAAILASPESKHQMDQLIAAGAGPIDLVAVDITHISTNSHDAPKKDHKIDENTGIDEIFLIRTAAHSCEHTAVLVEFSQYQLFMDKMAENSGSVPREVLKQLAVSAYEFLADFDMRKFKEMSAGLTKSEFLSNTVFLKYKKTADLRYGENPHQKAAFFRDPSLSGLSFEDINILKGQMLSFNNLNDLETAMNIALEFPEKELVAIVKHGNPTAVVIEKDLMKGFIRARDADKVGAFGATVVFNGQVDKKTAKEISESFIEVVTAPKYTEGAIALLKQAKKTPTLRVLEIKADRWKKGNGRLDIRSLLGGVVIQESDDLLVPDGGQIKLVSKRKPTRKQLADLVMAWKICKHVRSNAVVLVKDGITLGVGAGQINRIDALKHVLEKAGEEAVGACLACDAYIPFRNAIDETAKYGVSAIIEPGGARKEDEIISACDEHNIALCLTGMRHFRH